MDPFELEEKYVAPTYGRQPLNLVEGDGMKVKDREGNEYLDFIGGIAVCSLGHSHPKIREALADQAEKLLHVSNLYHIQPQAELAEKLAEVTPSGIQKFFFCNSGTEAVESALKLAVKHTGKDKIIALEGSFHGRTSASLGITWKERYRDPFKTLISDAYEFVPYDDLEALKKEIDDDTAAVVAEPIQGEGGINLPSQNFLPGLRRICDEKDSLLIFDEIQSGMCRTGRWFACEHWDVKPDIITMAKALGNGVPIGSMGAKPDIMDSFEPGDHAATFGGNFLACRAAKVVVEIMQRENFPQRASENGRYFKNRLRDLAKKYNDIVEEARGRGLMLGMELEKGEYAEKALEEAREDGFLINRTAGSVLRFVPPLIVKRDQIDEMIDELDKVFGRMD